MQKLTFEAIERFNESQLYDVVCDICRNDEPVKFILNWQSTPAATDPREIETWCAGLLLRKECYRIGGIWLSSRFGHLIFRRALRFGFAPKGYWVFDFTPQNV